MSAPVVLVATRAGAFVLRADRVESGPHFAGDAVSDLAFAGGQLWAAVGPALRVSDDLGRSWREAALLPVEKVWRIEAGAGVLYAGVQDAALFESRDGATWPEVAGLTRHATRARWVPEAGGLCLDTILARGGRLWVAVSAGGVYRSDDDGAAWAKCDAGVPPIAPGGAGDPDAPRCVHKVALDGAGRLFRQDHRGLYRSDDGGDSWRRIVRGLSSDYGFTVALNAAGHIFVAPLTSDEDRTPPGGSLAIYRSRDLGETWEPLARGLPRAHYHAAILRDALAAHPTDPAVLYAGTSAGHLFASADGGDSWRQLPFTFPRVLSVRVLTTP